MKAVILAAGKGKRMKDLTKDCPKPMLEAHGSPILEYIILSLKNMGIKEFLIITGYRAEVIEGYFKNGSAFGVDIKYKHQLVQDGTGKAPELARDFLRGSPFLLSYGDVLTAHENYPLILDYFYKTDCSALLSLKKVKDVSKGGAVTLDPDGKVTGLVEKPQPGTAVSDLENAGIYIFRPEIFDYTSKLQKSVRGEYELTDAVIMMIKDGLDVRGYELQGYWGDIGVPEALLELRKILEKKGEL
ncbi:MAG: NTP transferase domain-containing protein [Candidatus Aureabacteria bacterium]|nr:NTP transferase domain-containing protein [Candidatus Auribacterota bacterium]